MWVCGIRKNLYAYRNVIQNYVTLRYYDWMKEMARGDQDFRL